MAAETQGNDVSEGARQRIAWLTLALGFAAALIWFFAKSHKEGTGLAIGTALALVLGRKNQPPAETLPYAGKTPVAVA